MSIFDLNASLKEAQKRFASSPGPGPSRSRSDRGKSRLPKEVQGFLNEKLSEWDPPRMVDLMRQLTVFCNRRGYRKPARATVYHFVEHAESQTFYDVSSLPAAVATALYNLPSGPVPGHQLVFYCFNYGTLGAMSFAAGLPWLALRQAAQMRGWREKSRGLMFAVLEVRKKKQAA